MPTPSAPLRRDEGALASSVVAFLVAGIIFTGSVGAILVMSRSSNTGVAASNAPAAALNGQAKSLAQFLLDSPGFSATGGDWVAGGVTPAGASTLADGIRRLGLKEAGSNDPTLLNFSKFENLRMAPYKWNATDGYVNYEEARKGLGLDRAGLDFHIRAYPTLKSVQDILATGRRDPNLRVAYIGNVDATDTVVQANTTLTDGITYTTPTCSRDDAVHPQAYRISTTIRNGGNATTQFTGVYSVTLGTAATQIQNVNGPLVYPGQNATLFADVPAITGRSCAAGSTILLDLYDPVHSKLMTISQTLAASGDSGAAVPAHGLWVDTSLHSYRPTGTVKVNYDGTNLGNNDPLYLRVCKGSSECARGSADLVFEKDDDGDTFKAGSSNGNDKREVEVGSLAVGNYTAFLYDGATPATPPSTNLRVTERIVVTAAEVGGYVPPTQAGTPGPIVYTASGPVDAEVHFLDRLVQRFCPTYFDNKTNRPVGYAVDWGARCAPFKGGQSQPGDVFPDSKKVMNNDLPTRLLYPNDWPVVSLRGQPRYDHTSVLVVGSGVDQNSMTSGSAKFAVRDWVLGGGTLIVFGSEDQNVNWLEPIFHAAIRSSSGGLSVPDPGHPVLHSADELDYPHYSNAHRVWSFNGQTAQDANRLFTNIVTEGSNPVTTESNAGAMGQGTVILTTWMPYDVFGGARDAATTEAEGIRLVNNLLMQGYRDLFLDYGPSLPPNTNVVPAVREMQLCHPGFTDATGTCDPIQLSVVIFVFK